MSKSFILQWNCNGIYSHIEELKLLIAQHKPYIICIQETHLKPIKNFNLSGYTIYRCDGELIHRARGGVLVCVANQIHSEELIIRNCDLEMLCIKVHYPMKFNLCNFYCPPDKPLSLNELNNIHRQISGPCIFLGDFNAHNHIWGSLTTNNRGNVIEHFMDDHNLVVLNNNSPTHFNVHNGNTSIIDLVFVTPNLSTHFFFETHSDLCGSDHWPIFVNLFTPEPKSSRRSRWLVDLADWQKFSSNIVFNDTYLDMEVDQINNYIIETILNSAKNSIPSTSTKVPRYRVPWWSLEIQNSIRDRKAALNNFKRFPTEQNLATFRKSRAKARFLIRKAKTISWQNFSSSITSTTTSSTVWNAVRKISGRTVSNGIKSIKSNNSIITSQGQIATVFGHFYSSVSDSNSYPAEFLAKKAQIENNFVFPEYLEDNEEYNKDILISELNYALGTCKGSSPGPDDVHYAMLKNLDQFSKHFILKFYNKIYKQQQFPSQWREALVIPITKPDGNRFSPEGYRPISLTNCVCKVLEKIINKRLTWYLESNNLLYNGQFGFRKNRCTTDNLSILESDIQMAFSKKESLVAIILDLKQAYNKTWRFNIINSCISLNIKGKLLEFIKNFLKDRSFRILLGNHRSELFTQENGLPQGSILSSVLFNIHINFIQNLQIPRGIKMLLYADDILVYISSKNLQNIHVEFQSFLNNLSTSFESIGLGIAPTKSKAIIFSRKRKAEVSSVFTINNFNIPYDNVIKYLGIWFDKKLTWRPHFEYLKKKCTLTLNVFRVLSNTSWGANRDVLLRILQALILSKLNYGSIIFSSASASNIKTLCTIYNQGLRLCTGALQSSPIQSLLCISGMLPLKLIWQRELIHYLFKIAILQNHPLHKYISDDSFYQVFHNKSSNSTPSIYRALACVRFYNIDLTTAISFEFNKQPPWLIDQKFFINNNFALKNSEPMSVIKSKFLEIVSNHPNHTSFFTDGSKKDDKVGVGVLSTNYTLSCRISDNASIFNAELVAIYKALEHILYCNENNYIIFTDSMSSIQALQDIFSDNPIVIRIHDIILSLYPDKLIKFCWIPSHSGISGNEKADELANKARENNTIDNSFNVPKNFKSKLIALLWQTWEVEWRSLSQNKLQHILNVPKLSKFEENISRKDSVVITRLRIGHTLLTHKYLYDRVSPPACDVCHCQLSISHIFNSCLKYRAIRNKYGVTLNSLVDTSQIKNCLTFIKECNLYSKI